MKFRCRSCETIVSAREELAGKNVACPSCKTKLRVPGGAPAAGAPSKGASPKSVSPTAIQPAKRIASKPPEKLDDVEVVDKKKKGDKPKRRRRQQASSNKYLLPAAAGIGIALVVVLVGIVWMVTSTARARPQLAEAPPPPKPVVPILPPLIAKNRVDPPIVKPQPEPEDEDDPKPKPPPKVIIIPVEPKPKPEPRPEPTVEIAAIPSEFKIPLADEAKQEEREKDLLAHNRKTTVEAYDKVGKKNPAWDAAAREALEAAAKQFTSRQGGYADLLPVVQKAVDAGCDDPMIQYLHARASRVAGQKEGVDRLVTAGKALANSKYPAFRRAVGVQFAAFSLVEQSGGEIEKIREADLMLDAALGMIVQSRKADAAHPDVRRIWYDVPERVAVAHLELRRPLPDVLTRIDTILRNSPDLDAYRLHLRGELMIAYAWQARGNGFANTVTPDGLAKFNQRLADARLSLEKSWEKDNDSRVAGKLITVLKGSGGRDAGLNANVKTWFDRAMKANPDDADVCSKLMDYLDPRWHGSAGKVVGFGQECRDSKNWRAGITLMIAEAHYRAVALQPDPETINRYMRSNTVWNDIHSVYDEYFDHRPDDKAEHFRFAVWSFLCQKTDHAQKHFRLADNTVATMFVPMEFTLQVRNSMMR